MIAHDDELPAAARRILGEYRTERRMPPAAFDRVQRRLLRPTASMGRLAVVAAAAAAITVLALTALGDRRSTIQDAAIDPSQAADAARPAPAQGEPVAPQRTGGTVDDTGAAEFPAAPASIPTPTPTQAETSDAPAPANPPRASSHVPSPKASTTPPPSSTLAAERALLVQAQRALADGADDRVDTIVRRHAKDFPDGELRPEFAALQAMLRCRDPGQSAAAVLQAFTAAHANSPLIAAVRQVCAPR